MENPRQMATYCIYLDTSGPGVDAQRPPAMGGDESRTPKNIIIVEYKAKARTMVGTA